MLKNAHDRSATDFDTITDERTTLTLDTGGSFCSGRRQAT
jgi:hypothetical protein